jgi:hypothetical protein
MNTIGNEQFPSVAVDSSGNIYVSYQTTGIVSGGTLRGDGTTTDIVVFKMDTFGNMIWIKQHAVMNTTGNDYYPSTAVDYNGNVYVSYQTTGAVSGGTFVGGFYDIVVFKLDTNGNMVWIKEQRVMNTNAGDNNPTIAVDSSGNVYISYFTDGTVSGGTSLFGSFTIVVLKLDTNGNAVWVRQRRFMNPVDDFYDTENPQIAVDASGNVYVSYNTIGTVSGGWSDTTNNIVVFKLDTNGNMVWIKQQRVMNSNNSAEDINPTIAVDSGGNVYVSYQTRGRVSGGTFLGGVNDIVVFKLDTNGNMVWIRERALMNTIGNDLYPKTALDSNGNVYVSYYTTGTVSGGINIGSNDIVIFNLDTNGNMVWIKQQRVMNSTNNDQHSAIKLDSNGNIYVGYFTIGTVSGGTFAGGSGNDIVVMKFTQGSTSSSTVPSTPAAPTATAGNAQVSVAFVAPANGGSAITGYSAKAYLASNNSLVSTTTGASSPIVVTGLTNGTAYTFRVLATNANGNSAESPASASVTPSTVPSAPAAPTGTVGNAQVSVAFVAPANGGSAITGYSVKAYLVSNNSLVSTTTGASSPIVVTGLTNETAYTFTVIATNANGNSAESPASASLTPTNATAPDAPTTVTTSRANGSITVNWLAPFNTGGRSITSYTVTANPGGATQTTANGTTTTATFTTPTITAGTSYTFTVRATNIVGTGPASIASAPIIAAVAPTAPLNVAATASDRYATVTWDAPSNMGGISVSSYTITSSPATTTATTEGERTVNFTGLTNGEAYTFTVTASNAVGSSSASAASASVTPAATPADAAVAAAVDTPGSLSTYIASQSSTSAPDLFLEVKEANTTQIINDTIATTAEAQAVKVEFVDAMRTKVGASAGVNAVITVPAEETTTLMSTMAAGSIPVIQNIPTQVVLPAFVGTNATVNLQNVVTDGSQYLHVELPVGFTLTLTDGAVTKVLTFTGTTLTAGAETYQLGDEVQVGTKYYNIVALGSTTLHPLPSGQSFGDPYLTTLTGQTYKLPALNAPIRYYQGVVDGQLLTINATLRTVPSSDLSAENLRSFLNLQSSVPRAARATMAQRLLSESEDLCFFERVRITHGDRVLQLNIWDGKIRVEAAEGRFQTRARSTDGLDAASPYQRGYAGAAMDIAIAPGVKMIVAVYPTPLIRNGLVLMGAGLTGAANGVLCNVLGAEDMRLASLDDTTPVARVDRALQTTTETFVDHDGYRVRKVNMVRK